MKKVKAGFEIMYFPEDMLKRIEVIGRKCYKSEDAIGPGTDIKFSKMLIKNQHGAMVEHGGSITVSFIVDRGVTHEAVRHRLASFAQESTRYCNYSKGKFGSEITVIDLATGFKMDLNDPTDKAIYEEWEKAMHHAEEHYINMTNLGAKAQMARSVLPNSTKAEIVITTNPKEWRHILTLRTEDVAHPQMVEVMRPVLDAFKARVPVLFDDITY